MGTFPTKSRGVGVGSSGVFEDPFELGWATMRGKGARVGS